jgi:hypothetical protein
VTHLSLANVQPATNATFVASNGGSLSANYNVTSAILQQQTGRALAPGQAFQTVNLLPQGNFYPERINSLDLRAGKILTFGRTRTNVAIDIYNLFNSNTGTAFNQAYDPVTNGATWLAPTNPQFAVCAAQRHRRFLMRPAPGFLVRGDMKRGRQFRRELLKEGAKRFDNHTPQTRVSLWGDENADGRARRRSATCEPGSRAR